jgi:UDP-N-acetylmuramate--alanine ligase
MPIPGVSGQTFMEVLNDNPDHPKLHYVARRQEIVSYLMTQVRPGDLVITMGAGDVTAMGPQLLDELQAVDASSLQE